MSGFCFIPRALDEHGAVPVTDTWRTAGSQPADLLRGPYPVTATCATCGGRIKLGYRTQMGRQHVPAEDGGGPS